MTPLVKLINDKVLESGDCEAAGFWVTPWLTTIGDERSGCKLPNGKTSDVTWSANVLDLDANEVVTQNGLVLAYCTKVNEKNGFDLRKSCASGGDPTKTDQNGIFHKQESLEFPVPTPKGSEGEVARALSQLIKLLQEDYAEAHPPACQAGGAATKENMNACKTTYAKAIRAGHWADQGVVALRTGCELEFQNPIAAREAKRTWSGVTNCSLLFQDLDVHYSSENQLPRTDFRLLTVPALDSRPLDPAPKSGEDRVRLLLGCAEFEWFCADKLTYAFDGTDSRKEFQNHGDWPFHGYDYDRALPIALRAAHSYCDNPQNTQPDNGWCKKEIAFLRNQQGITTTATESPQIADSGSVTNNDDEQQREELRRQRNKLSELNSDLRYAQDRLRDHERAKAQMEANNSRYSGAAASVGAIGVDQMQRKIDDDNQKISSLENQIEELGGTVERLEERAEQQQRSSVMSSNNKQIDTASGSSSRSGSSSSSVTSSSSNQTSVSPRSQMDTSSTCRQMTQCLRVTAAVFDKLSRSMTTLKVQNTCSETVRVTAYTKMRGPYCKQGQTSNLRPGEIEDFGMPADVNWYQLGADDDVDPSGNTRIPGYSCHVPVFAATCDLP